MTPQTLLLRQINPNWVQGDRVTSQAFRPTNKDQGLLSVYDGDRMTPQAAWIHYTSELKLSSVGAQAVTVQECADLQLFARPDPAPFPEHAVIDFTGLSRGDIERKAKELRRLAEERGWLYKPEIGR